MYKTNFLLDIYKVGIITDLIFKYITEITGIDCRRINTECNCNKLDLIIEESVFVTLNSTINQIGSNNIDNIDVEVELIPEGDYTPTISDCLELVLQFKDPVTGSNIGLPKTYTTPYGTNFSVIDVADWESSFGIFGGIQTWSGNNWTLIGWSKNTPQGAFLLPNPLLAYDIEFSFQVKRNCQNTQVSNTSSVLTLVETIAITDNNTFLGQTLSQVNYVVYPIGGIEYFADPNLVVKNINLVGSPTTTAGTIYLIGSTFNSSIVHNDGNYFIESVILNYNNNTITVNVPLVGGIDFRTALSNAVGVAVGGNSAGLTPLIGTDYPVMNLVDLVDGEKRCIAVTGLTPLQAPKKVYLRNTLDNNIEIRIVFNLFINR